MKSFGLIDVSVIFFMFWMVEQAKTGAICYLLWVRRKVKKSGSVKKLDWKVAGLKKFPFLPRGVSVTQSDGLGESKRLTIPTQNLIKFEIHQTMDDLAFRNWAKLEIGALKSFLRIPRFQDTEWIENLSYS